MSKPLRVVFAGTPEFAASHLASLLSSRHEVVAIYTQPDRPSGRGKRLTSSPVKTIGLDHQIPIYQPPSLKSEDAAAELAALRADVLVVVAYGLLLPKQILDTPRLGCVNVHASLLPRWRGAAPIQRAIEAGDADTGITIMAMDEGLDTGAMLSRTALKISDTHTTQSLTKDLEELGPPELIKALDALETRLQEAVPQPESGVTYAHKISKDDAVINWHLPATQIERKIRALTPAPGCFGVYQRERIKIWEATADMNSPPKYLPVGTFIEVGKSGLKVACGEGALIVQRLQLPNKKPMPLADILNGNKDKFQPGNAFASPEE